MATALPTSIPPASIMRGYLRRACTGRSFLAVEPRLRDWGTQRPRRFAH